MSKYHYYNSDWERIHDDIDNILEILQNSISSVDPKIIKYITKMNVEKKGRNIYNDVDNIFKILSGCKCQNPELVNYLKYINQREKYEKKYIMKKKRDESNISCLIL